MVAPRWRKVLRDLSGHRFRTALVVLSIAVGVFAVAVVMGARGVLLREFDRGYAWSRAANATFNTYPAFDAGLVRRVEARPEVAGAEGRRTFGLRFRRLGADGAPASQWRTMRLWAVEDFHATRVERITLDPGAGVPGPGEVLLERSALQTDDYRVGETIEVEVSSGHTVKMRVAGFAHDLNSVPAMFMGATTGFLSFDALNGLGQPGGFNTLLVQYKDRGLTREQASRMAAAIRDETIEPTGARVVRMSVPRPGSHFLGDIFKAISLLLLALGVMSLFLSGFLVVNTVSALMTQQVRQVGIMKAVGGRAGQITGMYLAMVAVYGVLAVSIGVPAGAWAAKAFTSYAAGLLNFRIDSYSQPVWVVLLEAAVGLVAPLLAAIVPVTLGARRSVVRALNTTGIGTVSFGHGLLDKALGLLRGLPRPIALSLRNTFLRKGRLALTLTTLGLASAVVMAVVSVRASLLQTVGDLDSWWRYDAQVSFGKPAEAVGVQRVAQAVEGVRSAEVWVQSGAALVRSDGSENQDLSLTGLPADTDFVKPRLTSGRWLRPDDEDVVVVNTDVANDEDRKIRAGDRIRLKVGSDEREWTVAGIVAGQLMGPAVFARDERVAALLGRAGGADRLLVKTDAHSAAYQERVAAALERKLEDAGYSVVRVETQKEMRSRMESEFGILVVFLVIMAALLAAVGVIGLTGTMSINVLESTREIGVMRSIGGSHGWIQRIFITEGVTIGLLSWGLGATFAYPISLALVRMLQGAMKIPLTFVFAWQGVVGWLLLVLGIAAVASLTPAWRATRVSVRDAIAYE